MLNAGLNFCTLLPKFNFKILNTFYEIDTFIKIDFRHPIRSTTLSGRLLNTTVNNMKRIGAGLRQYPS